MTIDLKLGLGIKGKDSGNASLSLYNESERANGVHVSGLFGDGETRGVELGFMVESRTAYGLRVNIGAGNTCTTYGAEVSYMSNSKKLRGFRLTGLVGLSKDFKGIDTALLISGNDEMEGVQIAPINVALEMQGLQVGLGSIAFERFSGLQAGLICIAGKGKYGQLGLLTIRTDKDLPWYKRVSPIFGYRAYKGRERKEVGAVKQEAKTTKKSRKKDTKINKPKKRTRKKKVVSR